MGTGLSRRTILAKNKIWILIIKITLIEDLSYSNLNTERAHFQRTQRRSKIVWIKFTYLWKKLHYVMKWLLHTWTIEFCTWLSVFVFTQKLSIFSVQEGFEGTTVSSQFLSLDITSHLVSENRAPIHYRAWSAGTSDSLRYESNCCIRRCVQNPC